MEPPKKKKRKSVKGEAERREEEKWIGGKDYGLGSACGASSQICLPEARCSLAYFIRLNIDPNPTLKAKQTNPACVRRVSDSSPSKCFFFRRDTHKQCREGGGTTPPSNSFLLTPNIQFMTPPFFWGFFWNRLLCCL